jgi:orotate phosphoribosyltransferase
LERKNVLVIDDVITVGTAIRKTIKLAANQGGKVVRIVVALDRVGKGVDDGGPSMSVL